MHAVQKILIVDDELMMRMLLKQVIERSSLRDVSVSVAEDGEEALIKVEQEHPDLILLDVLLPKMNGYDVCQRIRRLSNYNPYIIILTARGNPTDRQRAESLGANEFMTKPFNASRLAAQLNAIQANADSH
ncbi:MAG TPA: response regulator [Aggregatilineales bacterium]|jgi:DNA-binding response OmpR family regulator|nr:response regulator [Anaerolineae bacterium]HUN06229.1 response regulator [Aggregatilineales bacterium]